jgi:hypothetical protein
MTPVSASPVEGAHRIELSTRLLYAIALKEEAPFILNPKEFRALPFNSTVHKPIPAVVYLQKPSSSHLCLAVTTHLLQLSRKIASQKDLYIKDTWRSLFQSICSALDEDEKFQDTLYETQQQLYEEPLHARQPLVSKARKNRERLGLVIADVIFAENPTSTLAAKSGANIQKWKDGVVISTWTAMDSNPFTTVRDVNLVLLSHQIYFSNIFCNCILSFSTITRMSPKSMSVYPIDPTMLV